MRKISILTFIVLLVFSISCDNEKYKSENLLELDEDLEIVDFEFILKEDGMISGRFNRGDVLNYDLDLTVRSSSGTYPDGFLFRDARLLPVNDRNRDFRRYTTIEPISVGIEEISNIDQFQGDEWKDRIDLDGISFDCKVSFPKPGELCKNGQICPEKSIIGGRTWICLCVYDCRVIVELF
jgi:hypothetical protein